MIGCSMKKRPTKSFSLPRPAGRSFREASSRRAFSSAPRGEDEVVRPHREPRPAETAHDQAGHSVAVVVEPELGGIRSGQYLDGGRFLNGVSQAVGENRDRRVPHPGAGKIVVVEGRGCCPPAGEGQCRRARRHVHSRASTLRR